MCRARRSAQPLGESCTRTNPHDAHSVGVLRCDGIFRIGFLILGSQARAGTAKLLVAATSGTTAMESLQGVTTARQFGKANCGSGRGHEVAERLRDASLQCQTRTPARAPHSANVRRRMESSASEHTVDCMAHGVQQLALVCTHILEALSSRTLAAVGFHEFAPTAEDPEPIALCNDCESVRCAEGVWNDRVDQQVQLGVLCLECFDGARRMASRRVGSCDA
jgi:hypothetical protein